ncbi:MAG: nuclear transport factor 2 family protein [Alphaproteobacteria bacterium]
MSVLFPPHKKAMYRYLDAFSSGDLAGVLELFAEDAVVHSPTQDKPKKPQDFYPALLERTKGAVFAPKHAFAGERHGMAAVLFDYRKPFPGGGMHGFDCVDVFSFDDQDKIKELWIVFDTKNLTKT